MIAIHRFVPDSLQNKAVALAPTVRTHDSCHDSASIHILFTCIYIDVFLYVGIYF